MVARAAALRVNTSIDGRPLPTKKRWRTSSKACAPHLLHALIGDAVFTNCTMTITVNAERTRHAVWVARDLIGL